MRSELLRLSREKGISLDHEEFMLVEDGTRIRYACWKSDVDKRIGSVLFLNGRTEFIEKYIETYQNLVQNGFDVWTLDWRGQGLSDRQLRIHDKGHVKSYQEYCNDLQRFVDVVTNIGSDSGKKVLLGHSMGGHIGLLFLSECPSIFDFAVFSSPMIDVNRNSIFLRTLCRITVLCGFGEAYLYSTGAYKPYFDESINLSDAPRAPKMPHTDCSFLRYTGDIRRAQLIDQYVRDNPALQLGGQTNQWLHAAFSSIARINSREFCRSIGTPTLIVSGDCDQIVSASLQQEFAKCMPACHHRVIKRAAH